MSIAAKCTCGMQMYYCGQGCPNSIKIEQMSNENKPLTAEEIMNKHDLLNGYRPVQSIYTAMKEYADQQNAALREELEAVTKENDAREQVEITLRRDILSYQSELESVKNERDILKGLCWNLAALSHVNGEVVDGFRVREIVVEMRRLSSGGTKPTSPWISVEDRVPEPHKWYLISTPLCAYPSMAGLFDGEKWINALAKESEIYNVRYYMEHPAPPETPNTQPTEGVGNE